MRKLKGIKMLRQRRATALGLLGFWVAWTAMALPPQGSDGGGPRLTNLKLAAASNEPTQMVGDWATFAVSELRQGSTDLNGDGDADDKILFLLNLPSGQIFNTRLSVRWSVLTSQMLAVAGESGLSVIELGGEARSLGFSASGLSIVGSVLLFTVRESSAGPSDLNGDGDSRDEVLFRFRLGDEAPENLGLAVSRLVPNQDTNTETRGPSGLAAFVSESSQGNTDLNGDGDVHDHLLFTCSWPCNELINRDLTVDPSYGESAAWRDQVLVAVTEHGQRRTDLNGDGDARDVVPFLVELSQRGSMPIELALSERSGLVIGGGVAGFFASERDSGGRDFNGDGDNFDDLPTALDLRTGDWTVLTPDLEIFWLQAADGKLVLEPGWSQGSYLWRSDRDGLVFLGAGSSARPLLGWTAVWQREGALGRDLNGDGDIRDLVLEGRFSNGQAMNLGLASTYGGETKQGEILVVVGEGAQGFTDLNGDGDPWDQVVHSIRPRPEAGFFGVENHGVAIDNHYWQALQITPSAILLAIRESPQPGGDLNGDGDTHDSVLHLLSRGLRPGAER
jgi:hypothetical protein